VCVLSVECCVVCVYVCVCTYSGVDRMDVRERASVHQLRMCAYQMCWCMSGIMMGATNGAKA